MSAQELQEPQEPDSMLMRVVNAHDDYKFLADFNKDEYDKNPTEYNNNPIFKFHIYKLRIEEIFKSLTDDSKLPELPLASLTEYASDLEEIAGGFYKLYGADGLGKLSPDAIQEKLDEASTQLSTAKKFQEQGDGEEYLRHLKRSRRQLFSLKELLDAVPIGDKTS